jgi:type IX secretion system PorP/SprF family membrane protein
MSLQRIIHTVSGAVSFFALTAQDIHFSQFNGSLMNISPAFTGLFPGDYRFGAIYRSQWTSVPVSYSTFSMYGERRWRPLKMTRDMIAVGLVFNNDRAGDARYGFTQLFLNGSYIWLPRPDSSLLVTFGVNAGWSQVGFDYSKMTFDNQFDGLQLNRYLPSGEQMSWTQKNYADFNAGSAIQYTGNKYRILYGIGVYHLSSPKISYQGNDISKIDFKFSNFVSYFRPLSEKVDLIAEVLLNNQGRYYELIPHVSFKFNINKAEDKAVSLGACYRTRDAVVIRLGYYYKLLQSGISYDINTSNFTAATNRRGAFEIFVNYVFRVKPPFIARKRNCPVFM